MKRLALLPLLALVGCASVQKRGAVPDYGSGGGFNTLPPLQLAVFGQGVPPVACSAGGACLVGSLVSSGAISGTTITGTGAGSFSTLTTTGAIIAGGVGSTYLGARHSAGYSALWFNVTPSALNYAIGSSSTGATDINTAAGTDITFNVGNTAVANMNGVGLKLAAGATKSRATVALVLGTITATVNSGAVCVCESATVNRAYCSVSGTTLTITGTGTDSVSYICL